MGGSLNANCDNRLLYSSHRLLCFSVPYVETLYGHQQMKSQQHLSLTEKIENAEKRITELKALIKHWKSKLDRQNHTRAEIK